MFVKKSTNLPASEIFENVHNAYFGIRILTHHLFDVVDNFSNYCWGGGEGKGNLRPFRNAMRPKLLKFPYLLVQIFWK